MDAKEEKSLYIYIHLTLFSEWNCSKWYQIGNIDGIFT